MPKQTRHRRNPVSWASGTVKYGKSSVEGKDAALTLAFSGQKEIGVRYGISLLAQNKPGRTWNVRSTLMM